MATQAILSSALGQYQVRLAAGLFREHHHARLLARLIYGAPGLFQGLAQRHPSATEQAWQMLRGQRTYVGILGGEWPACCWSSPPRRAGLRQALTTRRRDIIVTPGDSWPRGWVWL